jgi:coproporphyrinogen III oxidase
LKSGGLYLDSPCRYNCILPSKIFLTKKWSYKHEPEKDSEEGILMKVLKNPRDWLNE